MRPHRLAAASLPIAVGLLALPGAVAAATPVITTVSETPRSENPTLEGLTSFEDNPAIVDSHLQSFESWSRLPGDDALAVHFTSGTPECFGVHVEVQETTDIIAVKLSAGTVPEAVGRACIMIAVFGTVTVPLEAPIGDRAVVSIT